MNEAHLHLIVNHIPIFAVSFGCIFMVWAKVRASSEMRWASIILLILTGVAAWIATETGEGAEEVVEHLAGITKSMIHDHEEAAELANVSVWITTAAALGLAFVSRFKARYVKGVEMLVIILALVSSVLMARTAYQGGLIRHTELRADAEQNAQGPSESDEAHDSQE